MDVRNVADDIINVRIRIKIRKTGNVANHEIVIKEKEETEKVISFISTLLLVIYEMPNMLDGI